MTANHRASALIRRGSKLLSFAMILLASPVCWGQSVITYTYDEAGRLVGTVDSAGNAVAYKYDSVGNLVSISRSPSSQTFIIDFTPKSGPVGTTVTISGAGFSSTASQDTVNFNGTTANVVSATTTQIITTVPSGATSGTITVTAPAGTATSSSSFTVGSVNGAPTITSFTPTIGVAGTALSVNGTNFDPTPAKDRVKLNASFVLPTSVTTTTAAMNVPSNTSSGHITIGTAYGEAVTSNYFYIPPSPYSVSNVAFTGSTSFGGSTTVAINTAGQIGLLVFDATKGQQVSVAATNVTISCMNFTILNPNGSTLASTGVCGSTGSINNQTLPATGTYTILVKSGSASGSATFSLTQNITESIAFNTPLTVSSSVAGQVYDLTFSGTAGQVISVAATNVTISCMNFSILNPDGSTLNSTGVCGSNGSVNNKTLPATGTYTILVNSGSVSGSATISLTQNITESIAFNTPLTVSSSVAGQVYDLTFSGTAGQVISVAATNVTISCMNFSILNPDGSTLNSTGVCGSNGSVNNKTLPATGTYTILVNSGSVSGSATFSLTQNITESIAFNTPLTVSSTVAGQVWDLTFSGTSGQVVSVAVTNANFPTSCANFSIVNPDGSTLASTGVCGSNTSINNKTLPATGTYTILVNSNSSSGSATFSLTQNITESIAFNTPLTVSSTVAGQVWDLTFSGTSGQVVSVAATNANFPTSCANVNIVNPDGSTLASMGLCGSNGSMNSKTLPATGTYTILVNSNSSSGSATISLTQNITESIAFNTPLTVSSNVAGQVYDLTFSGTSGQGISVAATNVTISCMNFSIVNPDGSTLASTGVCGSSGSINGKTLPATGTYTILVNSGSASGSATFTLTSP